MKGEITYNFYKAFSKFIDLAAYELLEKNLEYFKELISEYRNEMIEESFKIEERINWAYESERIEDLNKDEQFYLIYNKTFGEYPAEFLKIKNGVIDPLKIAEDFDIIIKEGIPLGFPERKAMLLRDVNHNTKIFISEMEDGKQRKILTYEIVRFLLTPQRFTKWSRSILLHEYKELESPFKHKSHFDEICNTITNELLLPKEFFLEQYKRLIKENTIEEIAEYFGVDVASIYQRIEDLEKEDDAPQKRMKI